MKHLQQYGGYVADRAVVQFNPTKTYVFYMPGVRWRGFVLALLLLGTPGILYLLTYSDGFPGGLEVISLVLLVVIIASFSAKAFANRVVLTHDELEILKNGEEFKVVLRDIEDLFLANSLEEVDSVILPEGHYPMEFESYDNCIVVLILRDNTMSRSNVPSRNGIPTKLVSFNVSRADRFMAFMRMRV